MSIATGYITEVGTYPTKHFHTEHYSIATQDQKACMMISTPGCKNLTALGHPPYYVGGHPCSCRVWHPNSYGVVDA